MLKALVKFDNSDCYIILREGPKVYDQLSLTRFGGSKGRYEVVKVTNGSRPLTIEVFKLSDIPLTCSDALPVWPV